MELELQYLIPEIILLAAACICTLMGLSKKDGIRKATQVVAALAAVAAFLVSVTEHFGNVDFTRMTSNIGFNPNYITSLATLIGFFSILVAWDMPAKAEPGIPDTHYRGEFYGMLLFSLAGVAMIGKVNDLIWLFIVLELVSIPTYIMVATGRSQIIAQEAGIKYFFLGALAAAIFLFGFSYLYGATGATRFDQLYAYFRQDNYTLAPLEIIGFIMVIVGVGYKIAAWPLHFYAPDVYQGAATPVTAYLAFAPKTAGIIALISILNLIGFNFTGNGLAIQITLIVMAVVTMTVGNVMALLQRNIKRIFAYSSIAHSGYMLVGLISMDQHRDNLGRPMDFMAYAGDNGVTATIFYLSSYLFMNLGAFAVLTHLQGKADAGEDIDDIAGLAKSHPAAAFMMTLCMFSLIGMPLTVGFLGKFYIVSRAMASNHTILATIVMINAAIAAAYYLKIVAAMYLREPLYPFVLRKVRPITITALLCTIAVVVFFVIPGVLLVGNNSSSTGQGPANNVAPVAPRPAAQ